MIIKGIMWAESPIYRGNAKKTLFTRDDDGTHRLVSLAGSIEGTAQSLMDAFIGQSRNGKNIGLLNKMWLRLYGKAMPEGLISKISCKLQPQCYTQSHFFDLRMGMRLNEDRWASEANANYKLETVMRKSVFDFIMTVNDKLLVDAQNADRLYYILQELIAGRFWFGAGKSKGLGRLRLEASLPIPQPAHPPKPQGKGNHLNFALHFSADNPVLVGWNWGKIDDSGVTLKAADGQFLVQALRQIPDFIRKRLEVTLAGPIIKPEEWKTRFSQYLPRITAVCLLEQSVRQVEQWLFTDAANKKLSKGKNALSPKILEALKPFVNQAFFSQAEALETFQKALQKKANMAKRVVETLERQQKEERQIDRQAFDQFAQALNLPETAWQQVNETPATEPALTDLLARLCQPAIHDFMNQIDQHLKLLQSDAWIDMEILNRQEHLQIKQMLLKGAISETQWNDPHSPPSGVRAPMWREFLSSHERVAYRHMLNATNLNKSITNDQNMIAFIQWYRDRVRQELTQPNHIDFRSGGPYRREVSQAYGKPYDTLFMRMLTWSPSNQKEGTWEIYIPGSTIKGAFRRRASQILKTVLGETSETMDLLIRLFGAQGKPGLVFFSDAYLGDPENAERAFCTMDGVRMDPLTAKPIETAKRDYLFAYGHNLIFSLRLDLHDVLPKDLPAVNLLLHLLEDFKRGDIPLGGEKTNGMGWVQGKLDAMHWRTLESDTITAALFDPSRLQQSGIWKELTLTDLDMPSVLSRLTPLMPASDQPRPVPVTTPGYISHRSFGGYCGQIMVEARVLTPLHIRESGSPSYTTLLPEGPVHGFDFFNLAPPEKDTPGNGVYALPALSIKGLIRHIYTIASNTVDASTDISRLNPADALFGWVGQGPDQALMGRVVFDFARFENPQFGWFKAPYPYGHWQFSQGRWQETAEKSMKTVQIAQRWRVFPHFPLCPGIMPIPDFQPDTVKATYFRAIMPGSTARFQLRFWNLREEELQRLIWCIQLDSDMAHKLGHLRSLGCGSVRFSVLPDSFLIDWNKRYGPGAPDVGKWQTILNPDQWINLQAIHHHPQFKQVLDAHLI